MRSLQSKVLLEGSAQGAVLKLTANISFWGGVDPLSGVIIDRRHPQSGKTVAGKIIAMHRSIGSSSGSSVLLELFQRNRAPSGIILVEADMVVVLGAVVAREMEFRNIPVVQIDSSEFLTLPDFASITLSGEIKPARP